MISEQRGSVSKSRLCKACFLFCDLKVTILLQLVQEYSSYIDLNVHVHRCTLRTLKIATCYKTLLNVFIFRAYKWNYDPHRFPNYILEAQSLCEERSCEGGNYCQEAVEQMHVLHRSNRCQNGYFIYRLRTINITRSFTCAALATF